MKSKYLFLLSAAVLLVQVGSAIASAQPNSTTPTTRFFTESPSTTALEPSSEIPAPPWARDLNLSAEQRSRLQTIHQQAQQQGESLHQQLMAAEEQLRSLLQSDASIQQLRQQHQQVQQLRQQLDNHHFEVLLSERQVLTAEQLARLIQEQGPRRSNGSH